MSDVTVSRRQFDENAAEALKATADGPVVIMEQGRPSHVLLSYAEYRRLTGKSIPEVTPNIADLLYMPEAANIDFDPPKLDLKLKIPDFD